MLNEPFRETKNFRRSLVMNINAGGGRAIPLNLHVIRLFFCSFSLPLSLAFSLTNYKLQTFQLKCDETLHTAITIYLFSQSVWIVELYAFNRLYLISKASNSLKNNRNEHEKNLLEPSSPFKMD